MNPGIYQGAISKKKKKDITIILVMPPLPPEK